MNEITHVKISIWVFDHITTSLGLDWPLPFGALEYVRNSALIFCGCFKIFLENKLSLWNINVYLLFVYIMVNIYR